MYVISRGRARVRGVGGGWGCLARVL